MVNPARLIAAAGVANLAKRDTTQWTSVVSTSLDVWSEANSMTVFGYYTTTLVASGSILVTSTVKETTSTTFPWATSPLMTPAPLDAGCTGALSAYLRNLTWVTRDPVDWHPVFQVGFDPTCLPTGWYTVDYYSPGICPSGYTTAFAPIEVSTAKAETAVQCCYSEYTWNTDWGCVSYMNPTLMEDRTGSQSPATTTAGAVTAWTVVAQYTTAAVSTSVYNTPVPLGNTITTILTTSRTRVQTTTGHTIISGNDAAIVVAPPIPIRWASTDSAVLAWISSLNGDTNPPPSPTPTPHPGKKLSAGAIAGIAIGAVAGITFMIAAIVLCLRYRKKKAANAAQTHQVYAEPEPKALAPAYPDPVYVQSVVPKSELDSTALSAEQYAAHSNVSSPQETYKPFSPTLTAVSDGPGAQTSYNAYKPPPAEVFVSELPSSPRHSISAAGSTMSPPERTRSPSEWTDHTQIPDTDMSGFMVNSSAPAAGSRVSSSQLDRLKAEKARLQRLQEISEMESRLEEQLERELAEERKQGGQP